MTTRRAVSIRAESYAILTALAKHHDCSGSAMVERLLALEAKRVGVVHVPPPPPRPEPSHINGPAPAIPGYMEF